MWFIIPASAINDFAFLIDLFQNMVLFKIGFGKNLKKITIDFISKAIIYERVKRTRLNYKREGIVGLIEI